MERMMPIDLERKKLKKGLRGYDTHEVDALLERAAKEIETLLGELKQTRELSERQRAEIETFRAQESTLKEALLLAQRTADETRFTAHKEADLIVEEARRKAADLETQTQTRINDLRWELERLRLDRQRFVTGFRALLESHLREIAEQDPPLSILENPAAEA